MLVVALAAAAGWFLLLRPADPRPEIAAAADDYLAAWEGERWAEMAALVAGPAADFEDTHASMLENLRVEGHTVRRAGEVVLAEEKEGRATVAFDATYTLEGLGEWSYASELPFLETEEGWFVDWSPSVIYPELEEGLRFERVRQWPSRGAILDRNGKPISASRPVVEVGIQGQRVSDDDEVVAALEEHAGVSEEATRRALEQAEQNPEWFIPVTRLRRERYGEVRDDIYPVPGLVFRETTDRFPPDDAFARQTIGGVGEITAELLERFGDPYRVGDTVGRSGLELAFERDLAGSPSGEIRLVGAGGAFVRALERFEGEDGQPLRTTLDIEVQQAADAAVAGIEEPVGLVVLDHETAEVLAIVSRPLGDFNRAIAGRYPPGSTFKTVTTAAALASGTTPDDTVSCPGEVMVGGRRFKNAHDLALGDIPFRTAFSESCNTAFVQVAADLPGGALAEAAARFGFGADYAGFPLQISGGQFPEPGDVAELAAASIGQA
ncbi:MAG: penicillin-binding transpeptidase domain-containing protein, partial [Nitriliruptorales bacterium]